MKNEDEPPPTPPDGGVTTGTLTINDIITGVRSVLPARSTALIDTVCDQLESPTKVYIDEQVVYDPLSTLHWNSDPVSIEANATLADDTTIVEPDEIVVPVERSIVSGILVSMTKVVAAGVGSVLVARSIALTSNI